MVSLDGFIQDSDEPTMDIQHTRAAYMMGESLDREESWDDLVASLEKRYASTRLRTGRRRDMNYDPP